MPFLSVLLQNKGAKANSMIPRKRLDIGWRDLLFGMVKCLPSGNWEEIYTACKNCTASPDSAVFLLSVRSGFDAILRALELPRGGQILVHAITIPDVLAILKAHGLVPVPVDLDPETLCPDLDSLEKGIRTETVGILVTHLFGGRVPMDSIVQFAEMHGLFVFEDCAQGYWGDDFIGHPESDVCMFSFGPIKHNTSLGGALFFVRDVGLLYKVNLLYASYPVQSRWQFFRRLTKYWIVTFLNRPWAYTALCAGTHLIGKSHDAIPYLATRGFAGAGLFQKIRKQPSYPLLALMLRRLKSDAMARMARRRRVAEAFRKRIPGVCCPGHGEHHSYWLFPIRVWNAEELCQQLWVAGFDAHLWPVSLCIVPSVAGMKDVIPKNALTLRQQLLFLPVYPDIGEPYLDRLARIIRQFTGSQIYRQTAS
jgi:perosamine synthetase